MALGEARIEITPDLSGFEDKLKRSVNAAMDGAQAITDRATKEMGESLKGLSRVAAREFDDIHKSANSELSSVENRFEKMVDVSNHAIKDISKGDTFAGISRDAEHAADRVERSFKQASNESHAALGGIAAGLGKGVALIGTALAGLGISSFLREAALEAQAANKAIATTEALIKSTGGVAGVTREQVLALSDSLRLTIGVDDTAVIEASNVLLTFNKVSGPVFDEVIQRAADMTAIFGSDLSGAAMQLGKALQDPEKGINALRRSGVSFTAEQRETIKTMMEANDITGAQRLILDELATQFGGTAVASAKATDRIAANFGELREAMGVGLIGALDSVTPALVDLSVQLTGPVAEIGKVIGMIAKPVIETFGPVITTLVGSFSLVMEDLVIAFSALAPVITPIAVIIGKLAEIFAMLLRDVFVALAPAIALVGQYLGKIAEIVSKSLFSAIERLEPVLSAVGKVFADYLAAVLPVIFDLFVSLTPVLNVIVDLIRSLAPVLTKVAALFAGILAKAVQSFAGILVQLIPPLTTLVQRIAVAVIPVFETMAETMAGTLATVLPAILEIFQALIPVFVMLADALGQLLPPFLIFLQQVMAGIAPILPQISLLFRDLVMALIPLLPPIIQLVMTLLPPLTKLLTALTPVIVELVATPLQLAVRGFTLLVTAIQTLVPYLIEATNKLADLSGYIVDAIDFVTEAANEVTRFGGIWEVVSAAIVTAFNATKEWLIGAWETISQKVLAVFAAVSEKVITVTTVIKEQFSSVLERVISVASGIRDAFTVLVDFLMTVFKPWLTVIEEFGRFVINFFQVVAREIGETFTALVNGLLIPAFNVLKAAWDYLTGKLKEAWNEVMSAVTIAWNVFRSAVNTGLDIFAKVQDLASTAFGVVESVIGRVASAIATAFAVIESTLGRVIGAIGTAFVTLEPVVTKVASAIQAAFNAVFGAIARLWNNTVGRISFSLPDWLDAIPGVGALAGREFSVPKIPGYANGVVVDTPTLGIFGEAGPEAVIPISRPARAMQLMEQSGLADMARNQSSPAVMIQSAVFASATDADLVAQRVNAALRIRSFA